MYAEKYTTDKWPDTHSRYYTEITFSQDELDEFARAQKLKGRSRAEAMIAMGAKGLAGCPELADADQYDFGRSLSLALGLYGENAPRISVHEDAGSLAAGVDMLKRILIMTNAHPGLKAVLQEELTKGEEA